MSAQSAGRLGFEVVSIFDGSPRFAIPWSPPRAALFLALALVAGCEARVAPPVSAPVGEPLPNLTPSEIARFEVGRAIFARPYSEDEGLGPRFNENACNACHTFPTDGGTGETSVTKATRVMSDGRCDVLTDNGGENLRRRITPTAAELGHEPSRSISAATHTATFTIPFVYGLGIVDAISTATLEALADPEDADGDGISGRIGRDRAGRLSRFGRKADVATLADFADAAFRMEMGLTTASHPSEDEAGAIPSLPAAVDRAPDPEVDAEAVEAVVDFMRFLAPPAPQPPSNDPQIDAGRTLFGELGCATCHVPVLRAANDLSPAIHRQSIALFSDLLLHDMGAALTGTCAPAASPTEFRTEPLMGLRYRDVFLHDGRATRVIDAILLHGGEASNAREAFSSLDRVTQEAVLRYLNTL